jgi:hypothetical protein
MSYTAFRLDEIESALPAPRRGSWVAGQVGREITFEVETPTWIVRVYSGVSVGSTQSRDVGRDAIRCVLLDRVSGRALGKGARIHRTGDLKSLAARLKDRVHGLAATAREHKSRCGCGAVLVERMQRSTGKTFWGCIQWQICSKSND